MVDVGFFAGGLKVALAVALIRVPRHEQSQPVTVGGEPWISTGTAWLMAPNFAITNLHVIYARLQSEADASEVDFKLQAESATLWFDFDAPETDGLRTETKGLVTASKSLDYALLELVSPGDRLVPRIAPSIVAPDSTSRMAVNIVQHRRGEPKRVAFRNNLVSAANATTIRYFADTDQGSSGSPVCDDRWRLVAPHRGTRHVSGVQFQGKDQAFVNVEVRSKPSWPISAPATQPQQT
jgi:endonuclease G